MKTLFLFLIIYNLQNVFSEDVSTIIYKSYPKKVHPDRDNIKILNAGSYYKKTNQGKSFTRFQPPLRVWSPGEQKTVETLPADSNYFPLDFHGDLKSRVKKLPYFKDTRRSKRAVNASQPEPPTTVSAVQNTEAAKPKDDKPAVPATPKNASISRRSAVKKAKTPVKGRKPGQVKITLRKGNVEKTLRTLGKRPGNRKRIQRKRRLRSRVLRTGDKSPKDKGEAQKAPKEKSGIDKAAQGKASNDNTPKGKDGNDKAATGKAGNDKAGNDKVAKAKSGNDKPPKDKVVNDKPKEKPANAKPVPKKADKPVGRSQSKRRAPSKRSQKARVVASRRLIAARDAKPEDYPYVVSIQKGNEHWCSGAILNQQLITSTANCFWKSKVVSRMKVRAGAQSIDSGGQVSYIAEVRKHPNWSIRKLPMNDIALALLNQPFKFSDAVHAVDLPNVVMIPPFEDVWVTSFGAERRDGIFSRLRQTLQVAYMQMLPMEKCDPITKRFGVPLHDSFFCLQQVGRRAPCTRDTGAPAVSDGILWGLASWGIRKLCGTTRFPAMFTYVADESNMNFLVNATSEMMGEERLSPFLDRPPIRPRAKIVLPGEKVAKPDTIY